jgi:hypothetical protein
MWPERRKLIAAIEAKRKSRLICYLTSDRQNATANIAKDALPFIYDQLKQIGDVPRLDLLLFTVGGDTLAAFNVARLLREFSKRVGVLVPFRCLSAGTLMALGANEIYMTRAGTLSPIDPSVTTQLNPTSDGAVPGAKQLLPVSVESVAGFKSLIEKDWGIKDQEMLTQLFKTLAHRVHPLALGDVYRSRQQIERLAYQLMKKHRRDRKNVQKVIYTLTQGLGSHDYPISRTEARELLGRQIAPDNPQLEAMVWELYQDFSKEMSLGAAYNPAAELAKWKTSGQTPPAKSSLQMAVIESSNSRDVYEQHTLISDALVPGPTGPMKALQQELVDAGWKHQANQE